MIRSSPGGHGLIELNDYQGVEKLAQSHEGLQGVPLHKLHSVSNSGRAAKAGKVLRTTKGWALRW